VVFSGVQWCSVVFSGVQSCSVVFSGHDGQHRGHDGLVLVESTQSTHRRVQLWVRMAVRWCLWVDADFYGNRASTGICVTAPPQAGHHGAPRRPQVPWRSEEPPLLHVEEAAAAAAARPALRSAVVHGIDHVVRHHHGDVVPVGVLLQQRPAAGPPGTLRHGRSVRVRGAGCQGVKLSGCQGLTVMDAYTVTVV